MIIRSKFHKTKIIFGKDKRFIICKLIKKKNILVICSKRAKKEILSDEKFDLIKRNKIFWIDNVTSNPSVAYIDKIGKKFRVNKFNYIIAIGGGSTIDTAKAFMFMHSLKKKISIKSIINNPSNYKIKNNCRLIVLPTTSGTGSEVTSSATIWDKKNRKKLSLNHKCIYPFMSIVDPVLTYNLPKKETINSGLDCLNQAFESIWNKNYNDKILFYAYKSIKLSIDALFKLNLNINDKKSRKNLAKASLYSGICISQTRTSICHAMSYPLTAYFGTPHGLACAFTMIEIFKYINSFDSFFFKKLANKLRISSVEILELKLKKLFTQLKVKEKNKLYIKNKKKLYLLKKYMMDNRRSSNFIYPVDNKFLLSILKKSYF